MGLFDSDYGAFVAKVCARSIGVCCIYRPAMEYLFTVSYTLNINMAEEEKKTCSNKNTTHAVEHHWLLFIDLVGLVSLSVGYSTSYFSIIQSVEEANDRLIDRIGWHYTTILNKMCSIFTWSSKETYTYKNNIRQNTNQLHILRCKQHSIEKCWIENYVLGKRSCACD